MDSWPRKGSEFLYGDSDFVEDALGNLALTELAPLPTLRTEGIIQMTDGKFDRSKPDLRLLVADFLELWAAGEVKQIGVCFQGGFLVCCRGNDPVEDEPRSLEARL